VALPESNLIQSPPTRREPRIVARADHSISRSAISEAALKVLYRLSNAGYQAFIVGGGVRDLLLGREPKDFDVATDAHPDEVRELFRNCRLIGRRFRLAHVRFGREIIEVATFRGSDADAGEDQDEDPDRVIRDGRILRDNVYGTLDDDVWRRDFTINALYYNIKDFSVVDYVDGVADLHAGKLRLIGDPERRLREDPVRMLRAVRFAVKLGFQIDPDTLRPFSALAPLLRDIAPARLFEEVLKLFHGGYALQTFEALRHHGLFGLIFPSTERELGEEEGGFPHMLIVKAMASTDQRIAEDKPVTPAFLIAALLWQPFRRATLALEAEDMPPLVAQRSAADEVIAQQIAVVALPRRFTQVAREIWQMQGQLERRLRRQAARLVQSERFRAAYDFLVLRAAAGEPVQDAADWWTEFQRGDANSRDEMITGLDAAPQRSRRRRRPRRNRAAE
jgi:poly(A) polymerase